MFVQPLPYILPGGLLRHWLKIYEAQSLEYLKPILRIKRSKKRKYKRN